MNEDYQVRLRIGVLRTTDPRMALDIERAIDAAVRGCEPAGISAAAVAVADRVIAALRSPDGDDR